MKPALGVCYYPEQWPERLWEPDARRMAETGIAYVRIGELAWSRLEPRPGHVETGWLRRAMDVLHAQDLKIVVGTPSAAPPRWLVDKMPEMLPVDKAGHVRKFGSRRHYCFSHVGYREEGARIARIIATALKDHPGLFAWQVDNEYGCHNTTLSFSRAAELGFRAWLKARYETIAALNAAWGTVFWSMEYASFDEIGLPNLTPADASPTHWLDFRRYSSDQIVAFNKAQVDVLRAVTPDVPITTNYMPANTGFDHFRIGRDLDFASWDSYPLGHVGAQDGTPERDARYARQGDPDLQAFHHDLYRNVGHGRFWIMEQQPGPVNWAAFNPDPLPGMVRLWSWEAFAHGAEAVCYFRWRQAPFAQEQMHSGLLRPDDEPAPALAEARQVASEIDDLGAGPVPQPAECAIIYDYESAWAWATQPHAEGFSHFGAALAQYRQLRKLGLDVDILSPEPDDLSAYKLVFVPTLFAWTDALREALLRTDALVVVGPRSGSKTTDFHIPAGLPPDLPDWLDVKVLRVETLGEEVPVPVKGGGHVVLWRDKIETRAAILIESHDGWPVLVRQQRFFYLAALLDEEAHRTVTRRLAQFAGLKTLSLPEGLRIRRAGETTFVFNYGLEEHDLESLGFRRPYGLDGGRVGPGGVATARSPAR